MADDYNDDNNNKTKIAPSAVPSWFNIADNDIQTMMMMSLIVLQINVRWFPIPPILDVDCLPRGG